MIAFGLKKLGTLSQGIKPCNSAIIAAKKAAFFGTIAREA